MSRGIVKGGLNDGNSNIKRIQTGQATITTGNTNLDVTISAIDTTKSVILVSPTGSSWYVDYDIASGVITNSTTITLSRGATGGGVYGCTVYWTVIEFKIVKSLQSGSAAMPSSSTNVTISAVNIDNCLLFCSAKNSLHTQYALTMTYNLTTTTNLYLYSSVTSTTVAWQVIEFY